MRCTQRTSGAYVRTPPGAPFIIIFFDSRLPPPPRPVHRSASSCSLCAPPDVSFPCAVSSVLCTAPPGFLPPCSIPCFVSVWLLSSANPRGHAFPSCVRSSLCCPLFVADHAPPHAFRPAPCLFPCARFSLRLRSFLLARPYTRTTSARPHRPDRVPARPGRGAAGSRSVWYSCCFSRRQFSFPITLPKTR